MNIDLSQIIIQILAFLIMLWILKRFGWAPLMNLLEERQIKIKSEFDSIDQEYEKIKNLNAEYCKKIDEIDQEARDRIQVAVHEAHQMAKEIREESLEQANKLMAKTKEDILRENAKACHQLKSEIVNLVISTCELILKEKIDIRQDAELIEHFLEEKQKK